MPVLLSLLHTVRGQLCGCWRGAPPHLLACEKSHHHPVPRKDTHLHQVPEHTENLQQEFLKQEENLT